MTYLMVSCLYILPHITQVFRRYFNVILFNLTDIVVVMSFYSLFDPELLSNLKMIQHNLFPPGDLVILYVLDKLVYLLNWHKLFEIPLFNSFYWWLFWHIEFNEVFILFLLIYLFHMFLDVYLPEGMKELLLSGLEQYVDQTLEIPLISNELDDIGLWQNLIIARHELKMPLRWVLNERKSWSTRFAQTPRQVKYQRIHETIIVDFLSKIACQLLRCILGDKFEYTRLIWRGWFLFWLFWIV